VRQRLIELEKRVRGFYAALQAERRPLLGDSYTRR
jgi:hypothetical protein